MAAPLLAVLASEAAELLDLHADNWDAVLEANPLVLVHFWAPFDPMSMAFRRVHEVVAARDAALVSEGEAVIVHARSDVTDQRGYTRYLTEWGVTRYPTVVMFHSHRLGNAANGAPDACSQRGSSCTRVGDGACSCSSMLPHDGRPTDQVPNAALLHAWARNFTRRGPTHPAAARPARRRLHLDHEGEFGPPEELIIFCNPFVENDPTPGCVRGWQALGAQRATFDWEPIDGSRTEMGLGRPGDCQRDADGQCLGCTLDTRPGANTVFPSGWDNPNMYGDPVRERP